MKSTPLRSLILVLLLFSFLILSIDGQIRQIAIRIHLATTLISTWFLFPLSNIRTVLIDENSIKVRNDERSTIQNQTLLPSIIHQINLGGLEMRESWMEAQKSCKEFHPNWQFKLWKDEESNTFVQQEFPAIYSTYTSYPLEIQRSNVLRYLILDKFGGIYLDLDLRCKVSMDIIRNETFLTPPANPNGINNAFIASLPNHPFWLHVQENLPIFNQNWFNSPYITNMVSTGCHFLSTMHRLFPNQSSLGVLDQNNKLNGHVETPLFEHLGASSWHKGDAKAILLLGKQIENGKKHPILFFFSTFFLTSILILSCLGIHLCCKARRSKRKNYQDIEASKSLIVHHVE